MTFGQSTIILPIVALQANKNCFENTANLWKVIWLVICQIVQAIIYIRPN